MASIPTKNNEPSRCQADGEAARPSRAHAAYNRLRFGARGYEEARQQRQKGSLPRANGINSPTDQTALSLAGNGRASVTRHAHRQVFGLVGRRPRGAGYLLAAASQLAVESVLNDGFRSHSPLRGSPGLAPGSLLRRSSKVERTGDEAQYVAPPKVSSSECCAERRLKAQTPL